MKTQLCAQASDALTEPKEASFDWIYCEAIVAARRAAAPPAFDPDAPLVCTIVGLLDGIRGEVAISVLAQMLEPPTES